LLFILRQFNKLSNFNPLTFILSLKFFSVRILFLAGFMLSGNLILAQVKTAADSAGHIYDMPEKKAGNNAAAEQYIRNKTTGEELYSPVKTGKPDFKAYLKLSATADSLLSKSDYINAAMVYHFAFAANGGQAKVIHRYNLAVCWAKLNKPDSAFVQLWRIADKGKFYNYHQLNTDTNFAALRNDAKWEKVIERVKENSRAIEKNLNESLPMRRQNQR
jgi:hypothetical protein